MAVAVSSLILKAAKLLQDERRTRWTDQELLIWLNLGQNRVVSLKPTANTTVAASQLAAGTLQTLPSGGISLLDVPRNMGDDGLTPGRVITQLDLIRLGALDPNWHTATADDEVLYWIYDPRTPKKFWVYPPVTAASDVYVDMVYAALPTACTIGGDISLADEYEGSLLDYMLYRAFSKDLDAPNSLAKAQSYLTLFMQGLDLQPAAAPQEG